MTTAIQTRIVPDAIVRKLTSLIWRARMVLLLRGAMATVVAAVVCLLVIMAIDRWVVIFKAWPRWALSLSGLGVVLAVAGAYLVRPLAHSFTLAGIARMLEARHPELQERISSTVELMTTSDSPELRGSDVLIAALAEEAVLDARTVSPAREIRMKAAVPYLAAAAACLALLTGIVMVWPAQATPLLQRALLPFANVSRVSSTALSITDISAPDLLEWNRDGIDYVMLHGRRLHVELEAADDAVTSAELRRSPLSGGEETAIAMTRLGDGPRGVRRLTITCPPAGESFRFRLHAGDALTRFYAIQVVPQPTVRQIDLRYEFPAYTGREPAVVRSAAGSVAAVAGTIATIVARSAEPVVSAEFLIDGRPGPAEIARELDGTTACTFHLRLEEGMTARWAARLKDQYGFANEPTEYPIKALADARPTVTVQSPNTTRLKLRPTDQLPVAYQLKDDFGVTAAQMLIEVDGQARPPMPLEVGQPRRTGTAPSQFAGSAALDLAALPLQGARQVTFRLKALDNLPPELKGPQEGFSDLFTIQLDVKAPSFAEQVLAAEELRIRQVLEDVLKDLKEAKNDSAPLRRIAVKAETIGEPIISRVDRIRTKAGSADKKLRDLVKEIAGGVYAVLATKITSLADEHIAKAYELAGQIKITDQARQRGALADETDFQIDRAIAIVTELLKELGALTDKLEQLMELEDLAAREAELAEALADMKSPETQPQGAVETPPDQAMTPEEWQKAQQDVTRRMADMTRQTPGALEAQLRKDREQTRNLLEEARKLAKDQGKLAGESEQAARLDKLSKALEDLAARQADLADQAAATPLAADQSKGMKAAAEDIRQAAIEPAVEKQTKAETELERRAAKAVQTQAQAQAGEDLAAKAERIAREQKALAQRAEAPGRAFEAAKAQAAQAAQQVQQAKQEAARAAQQVPAVADPLQKRQEALAEAARNLQQNAAANPVTAAAAEKVQPAKAMEQAAADLAARKLDQAAGDARTAQQQTEQLAGALEQARKDAAAAPADQRNEQRIQTAGMAVERAKKLAGQQKDLADDVAAAAQQARSRQGQAEQAAQRGAARESAADQQTEQAKRQAGELSEAQQGLSRQAAELTAQAASASPAARQAVQQHNPTPEMNRAADAMAARQPPQASQAAAQAAEKAEQLAKALRQAAQQTTPQAAAAQGERLADLARKQAELRRETAELLRERARLERSSGQQELARLQREQAQLAGEVEKLADELKKTAPQPDRADTQAARAARAAADELAAQQVPQAAKDATQAGEKLDQVAGRLNEDVGRAARPTAQDAGEPSGERPGEPSGERSGEPSGEQPGQPSGERSGQPSGERARSGQPSGQPPGQPSGENVRAPGSTAQEPGQVATPSAQDLARRAGLADTAGQLASRQKDLAKQIKALAEGDRKAMLAAKQQDVTRRTGDLDKAVERIEQHAEELIPDDGARREAREASRQLDRAEEAQGQAGRALESGQPAQATAPQQAGAQAIAAAADALERLGRSLAAAAQRSHPAEAADESQEMANGYEAASEAGQSQQVSDAAVAAQQLQALAQTAAAQAQAMGMPTAQRTMPGQRPRPGRPAINIDSKVGTGIQVTDATAAKLEKLGISLTDWARLPGKLRDQVLQAAASAEPEEYRVLIQRYFREVARRGGAAQTPPPAPSGKR